MFENWRAPLAELWSLAKEDPAALNQVAPARSNLDLPSSFKIGMLAQASIAACGLAAWELLRLRNKMSYSEDASVLVERRAALAEFRSERYLRIDGGKAPELWDPIAGAYLCGDGRWVRVHTNFVHHRDGLLRLLGCENDRDSVAKALSSWKAQDFEETAAQEGLVVAMMRSFEEWDAHPQGRALATTPPLIIERIDDEGGAVGPQPAARPLRGYRVLDLSRIIAAPVAGRTLAAHGAEVMRVAAPHLPAVEPLVIDTGRGKLSSHLDLRSAEGRERLRLLLQKADVMLQAYRPGAIESYGFGPAEAAKIRPGLIYASLSAYGHEGPWANRRGFDSLVQTATGFNHGEAAAAGEKKPRPLPCQALDHASGYFLAFGIMAALKRRAESGGSWHVRVSLAATGQWLRSFGQDPSGFSHPDQTFEDIRDLLEHSQSAFGQISAIRHSARLKDALPFYARPVVPLGSHEARWPN